MSTETIRIGDAYARTGSFFFLSEASSSWRTIDNETSSRSRDEATWRSDVAVRAGTGCRQGRTTGHQLPELVERFGCGTQKERQKKKSEVGVINTGKAQALLHRTGRATDRRPCRTGPRCMAIRRRRCHKTPTIPHSTARGRSHPVGSSTPGRGSRPAALSRIASSYRRGSLGTGQVTSSDVCKRRLAAKDGNQEGGGDACVVIPLQP
jgi:hypothetical protein